MIARFINRHFVPIASVALALVVLAIVLLFSGCGLRDDESRRPPPAPVDVMDDVQASADRHPLEGWSR